MEGEIKMLKKSLIAISIFCILAFVSSSVFASNLAEGAENALNNIKGGVQNMANDAGAAMGRAKDRHFKYSRRYKRWCSRYG